jgi:hypothetical protein
MNNGTQDLLNDLEHLLAVGSDTPDAAGSSSTAQNRLTELLPGRRGRPRTRTVLDMPIREMSPRQLAREDLIDTAMNWAWTVATARVKSLNSGRGARANMAINSRPSRVRADRIERIAALLSGGSPRMDTMSARSIATFLMRKPEFSGFGVELLRKDVAAAKKRVRHT